jgi:hypothetical protein
MRGISLLAIVVGGVSDVVLSGLLGVPLMMHTISSHALAGIPKAQLQSAVMSAVHADPVLYAAELGIGLACSALGGFIAASIAKQRRILNGVLASWLCVGVGVYSFAEAHDLTQVGIHVALIAVTPLCYWLGAVLRIKMIKAIVA